MSNDEWGFLVFIFIIEFLVVSFLVERKRRKSGPRVMHNHSFDPKTGKCECGEEWF